LVPNPPGVVLVEDIASLRPESAPGAGPAPSVERALRDVLGAAPNPKDPAAFLAALERSFAVHDPAGSPDGTGPPPAGTVVSRSADGRLLSWTPRGYALQADLGALSGAQASLYRRAQQALEEALPLIEGLEPLIPFEDEETIAAQREVVRSELERAVQELGSEGGPSVGLVDQLLESLVDEDPANPPAGRIDAEAVGGHLGDLREHFGLKRELINTLEEEQNFTNFLVLSDYVTTLFGEWAAVRASFTGQPGGAAAFFGTQLVLIARELQVASESVHEVIAALDAVLVGPSERQTLSLPVTSGTPATTSQVFLGQLLEWADRFLTVDARHLIETAGREGAISLLPTLTTLRAQVDAFAQAAAGGAAGFPALFRNLVVQSTLEALRGSLDKLVALIGDLGARQPVIGFPLRPPAIQVPPFPGEIVIGRRLAPANTILVRTRTGADLSSVRAVLALGGVRRDAAFRRVGNAWEAEIPRGALPQPGTWTVLLHQDGSDWPVGTHTV
jgi:hypothetical protein